MADDLKFYGWARGGPGKYDVARVIQTLQHAASCTLHRHSIKHSLHHNGLIIVVGPNGMIDYWPSSGFWKDRRAGIRGSRGLLELFEHMDVKFVPLDNPLTMSVSIIPP